MPSKPPDVLADLADLPGVAASAEAARSAVDALLWDRHVRRVAVDVARQSVLRGGWASAAMDGAEVPFDSVVGGTVETSPMGERTGRAVALTAELPRLVDIYARAPLQAWARMNTVLAGGLAPDAEVGRPRVDSQAEDPLRLGGLPSAMEASGRLTALAAFAVAPTAAPAIVSAGVVHAELAVLRPFRHASGPLARASIRLALASRGLDPDLLTVPEWGLLTLGRTKYVHALRSYASGTPAGVADWLTWFGAAVKVGAEQAAALAAAIEPA